MRSALLLSAACCLLAGCGAGARQASIAAAPTSTTATSGCLPPARARRALARGRADIASIRRLARAARPSRPALERLTNRFLLDIAYLDAYTRNDLIDRAVGALAGSCPACFQAVEAMRPIPAIAAGEPCR